MIFLSLLWLLSDILLPFVGGIALAYIQAPLADRVERFGVNRTVATLLIVTVLMAAIILFIFLLISLLSQQTLALMAALPGFAARLQARCWPVRAHHGVNKFWTRTRIMRCRGC